MATSFFGGAFFGGEFFNQGSDGRARPDDGPAARRRIVKPLGIVDRPQVKARPLVSERIDDSRAIAAQIAAKLAREFGDETASESAIIAEQQALEVARLSAAQVDFEIGVLLRKKLRTEEDELLLMLLVVAASA